jgi:hypothetical protein
MRQRTINSAGQSFIFIYAILLFIFFVLKAMCVASAVARLDSSPLLFLLKAIHLYRLFQPDALLRSAITDLPKH